MKELCATCTWWMGRGGERGRCSRTHDSSGLTHGAKMAALQSDDPGLFGVLMTDADFGCVQWEKKGREYLRC